uniref:non-specific serine/threonine protein kinase n=1 Tax=Cyprinodon variegatus TaxID=28743 RepID=A0A3Q2DZ04_CYPVA
MASTASFAPPKLADFILTERLGSGTYATVYKSIPVLLVCINSIIFSIIVVISVAPMPFFGPDTRPSELWAAFTRPFFNLWLFTENIHPIYHPDFGFAQYMSPWDEKSVLRGSPLYMAPEMVCRRQYDSRVDLWSVGVILYEALFGRAPFASKSYAELEEKIRSNQPVELPPGARVSKDCRDLLLRLLERNPDARITFEEFFTHPFLDMEHMPSAECIIKARELVTQAVQKDQEGERAAALTLYCHALEYFVPAIHYETERQRKDAIRQKVKQYVSRAEELKALLASDNKRSFEEARTSRDVLREMSKDQPRLLAALDMASTAIAKEEYGSDDHEALDVYQQCLGELLLALAGIPIYLTISLFHCIIHKVAGKRPFQPLHFRILPSGARLYMSE